MTSLHTCTHEVCITVWTKPQNNSYFLLFFTIIFLWCILFIGGGKSIPSTNPQPSSYHCSIVKWNSHLSAWYRNVRFTGILPATVRSVIHASHVSYCSPRGLHRWRPSLRALCLCMHRSRSTCFKPSINIWKPTKNPLRLFRGSTVVG